MISMLSISLLAQGVGLGVGLAPTTYMVLAICLVLLVGAGLLLIRALRGPTVFDRILAVNAIGTKTVVLVACIAFLGLPQANPGFFLDTSLVYALINFVATIAILKYIQYRRLS